MIRCPECKKLVDENNTSCKYCGYPFNGTEEKVNVQYCMECGAPMEEGLEICPECGTAVKKIEDKQEQENIVQDSDVIESATVQEENAIEEEQIATETKEKHKPKIGIPHINNFNLKKNIKPVIGVAVAALVIFGFYKFNEENQKVVKQYNELMDDYNSIKLQLQEAKNENSDLSDQISKLEDENYELKNGASTQLNDIKNSYEQEDWEKVIELAGVLHSKYNGSAEDEEAQKLAAASQEKIDEANAAKEAEKAKGYETGITYDQLARTPDDYEGKKVKFKGKVVQVIEGDDTTQIRLAVNDDYDTVLFGEYSKSIVSSRVLEDDYITVYGTSVGTISYKSTMGGTITIPGVYIEKIDQ